MLRRCSHWGVRGQQLVEASRNARGEGGAGIENPVRFFGEPERRNILVSVRFIPSLDAVGFFGEPGGGRAADFPPSSSSEGIGAVQGCSSVAGIWFEEGEKGEGFPIGSTGPTRETLHHYYRYIRAEAPGVAAEFNVTVLSDLPWGLAGLEGAGSQEGGRGDAYGRGVE